LPWQRFLDIASGVARESCCVGTASLANRVIISPGVRAWHSEKQMKSILTIIALAFFLTSCATSNKPLAESKFKPLFDGKTLNGWQLVDKKGAGYHVKNGVIVCPPGGGGDLFTEKQFSDFILRLDFKLSAGANNGIGFRAPLEKGQIGYIGNEIQIIDDTAKRFANLKDGQKCGSLYRVFPARPGALKPVGEWNQYEISAIGRQIKVVLNGKVVVDGNINDITDRETLQRQPGVLRPKGHIALLGHGSHVEFKNIRIHELPRYIERPNSPPPGFTNLFNGRDLAGWRGYVGDVAALSKMSLDEWAQKQVQADELMLKNWKAGNGMISYVGKGFDNLVSRRDDYRDFELLVDWRIDPKADSGIYLRGCPQVQIWEANSPSFDPKHPGSGGLFNNKNTPNYPAKYADHLVGEWNRFRILMVGDRVHVFLNNELVVQNLPLENYWERDKPAYPFGPIELQAHTTPVQFRNIYIRELPRAFEPAPAAPTNKAQ
jgi:hypothetical protein